MTENDFLQAAKRLARRIERDYIDLLLGCRCDDMRCTWCTAKVQRIPAAALWRERQIIPLDQQVAVLDLAVRLAQRRIDALCERGWALLGGRRH